MILLDYIFFTFTAFIPFIPLSSSKDTLSFSAIWSILMVLRSQSIKLFWAVMEVGFLRCLRATMTGSSLVVEGSFWIGLLMGMVLVLEDSA